MLKHIVTVFVLGVLLREASADIECFLRAIGGDPTPPKDMNILCHEFVKSWRSKLHQCEVTEVNLDGLDSYVKEVCTEGTDLRKDIESSAQCLMDNNKNIGACAADVDPKASSMSAVMKNYCEQRNRVNSCIMNKLGRRCDKAGMNVISKGQIAGESFMKDICYLVGGAAANSIFMWLVVMCVSITLLKWH